MKISIVTPCYNSGKYIRETLESIHNQSYSNFEHIVMDAVSKDNTLDIIKSYDNVTLVSEKDKGQSDALNKGFRLASGDILAWQNSDDVYSKDTFRIVTDFFKENPHIDVVYGYYQLIDSQSKWICDVYPIRWNQWLFQHGRFCPPQPAVFWRRKVWEQTGPLDESLHFCMDVDFYSRAIINDFKFARIDHILGQFRVHESSKTQNVENERKVYNEYKNVLRKHFHYNALDSFLFEFFRQRAKLASTIKQKYLRKM